MLTVAGVALVLGLVSLVLGLRGRRTGVEPRCAFCDFDLTGLREREHAACPECGRSLALPAAVRTGRRRRRRSVLALAGALLIVAAAAGLLGMRSVNWVKHMPSRVLAEYTRWTRQDTALVELSGRLLTGDLSAASVGAVVDAALAVQADVSTPWNAGWGAFVETATIKRLVSPDQERRYLDQMVTVASVATREATVSGWRVPVKMQLAIRRGGVRGVYVANLLTGDIKGYERPALPYVHGAMTLGPSANLSGGETVGRGLIGNPDGAAPAAPPGVHPFAIEFRWWTFWEGDQPTSSPLSKDQMPAPSGTWSQQRQLSVGTRIEDVVTGAAPDDVAPEMTASELGITMRHREGAAHTTRLERDWRYRPFTEPNPADMVVRLELGASSARPGGVAAYEVFVVGADGREQWLGRTALAPGTSEFVQGTISLPANRIAMTVVLRPSMETVLMTPVGTRQLATEELVIEGVPVVEGWPRTQAGVRYAGTKRGDAR